MGGHAHAFDKYLQQHHEAVYGKLRRRKRAPSKPANTLKII